MQDGDLILKINADFNENIKDKVNEIDKSIAEVGNTTKRFGESITTLPTKLGDNAEKATVKLKKLQSQISELAKTSRNIFLGLSASAVLAVKKYTEFEAGILKVRTISDKSFKDIKKSAEELSVKYGISVGQITEGNYQLVSSMGDVAEAQEILETTAKLSIAGFTDYASAMNGLVAVMNGYKMEAKDSARVADILMTVQNKGVTTINELQSSLSRVTGTANNVNVSFENLAAAMATITSNKVETSEAATSLRAAFSELAKSGTTASDNFKKATGEMFSEFMKSHTIVEAVEAIENYSKKTKKSIIDLFSSVEAGNAILNLSGTNLNKLKDSLDAVYKSSGTADKGLAELDKGGERAFSKLKEQANQAVREIGEALIPQVKELTEKLSKVKWDEVFSQENINKVVSIGKAIGGVSLAIMGINGALKVVDSTIKASAGLKTLFALLTSKEIITTSGAYVGAGIGAKTTATTTLSSTGLGALALGGLALNYAAQKTTEKAVGQTRDTSGMNTTEKLKSLREEIDLTTKQIKAFEEANNGMEDTITTTGLETATKKLSKLKEEYKKLKDEYADSEDRLVDVEKIADTIEEVNNNLNNNLNNSIGSINTDNSNMDAIKDLMKDYQDFTTKVPKFWDLIGLDDKAKLEEKVSFFKSALQKSIDLGAKNLIPIFKSEFDKAENQLELKIKSFDFSKAKEDLEKKLSDLNGNGITSMGKKGGERDVAEYEIMDSFLNTIKNGSTELEQQFIEELKIKKDNLGKKIELDNKEREAQNRKIESYNQAIQGLSSLSGAFTSLGSTTGSKTFSNVGQILGSAGNLFKAFSAFGGSGGAAAGASATTGASIAGTTAATGATAAGAATTGATAAGAMASVGSMAAAAVPYIGAAVAVIGAVQTVNSILGAKGKKKAARIDARNQENENRYQEQVKAMQALTQALVQNSERLKSFADRMLIDVAKNPTLRNILGGEKNFTTVYDAMIQGKHFNDIDAIERGSARYRSGFRKKRKDTFTAVKVSEDKLLKYLGFDKTELDLFTDDEMRQLKGAIQNIGHNDLRKATGRDLTKSNIEEWKNQINEFVSQIDLLEKEKKELFRGSTLESFIGVEYKAEKELIAEYTEQFKQLGLVGEQYSETIKEMAKNNQVLVSTMQDVRASTIEALSSNNGGFTSSMKGYFEKIFKNASSIAYDVAFSDMDSYFNKEFEKISEKLVEIKRTGKLDFSDLFTGFDFEQLKLAEINEIQAKKSLDVLKLQLLNSGIDLSIVNKILPQSDFNDRINDLKSSLSTAMSAGLEEHKFDSFTKSLGQSLYDSTKSSLVKAFSESSLYQGMIQKFVNVEDFKSKLEAAGSFKEAFALSENLLKKFGYEMEANGFGGFDAINNKADVETQLGNAYYQDKASSVNINVTNNFNREVYGVEDFKNIILDTTEKGIKLFFEKPKVLSI